MQTWCCKQLVYVEVSCKPRPIKLSSRKRADATDSSNRCRNRISRKTHVTSHSAQPNLNQDKSARLQFAAGALRRSPFTPEDPVNAGQCLAPCARVLKSLTESDSCNEMKLPVWNAHLHAHAKGKAAKDSAAASAPVAVGVSQKQ